MIFSERLNLAEEVKEWMNTHKVPLSVFNTLVALERLGYLGGIETYKEEIKTEPFPLYKEDEVDYMYDREFLQLIHDRLKSVHNENPNVDYMLKLRSIIEETPDSKYTPNIAKCVEEE